MRIGVDLGGTNIAAGIVGDDGKILVKKSLQTRPERGSAAVLADIVQLCKELTGETAAPVRHVGIGVPGTVNPVRNIILDAPNIYFKDVSISQEMSWPFDIPIILENDANCAALGEARFGAARESENSITITLGTGIGGGLVIGGKVFRGSFFGAGEVGHQIIRAGGNVCGCGRRGCWEAYASAASLVRQLRHWQHRVTSSAIIDMVEGNLDRITAKIIFGAASAGDALAREVVDEYINNLCIGMANLVNIFQPDIMVIGGGVSGHGQGLIDVISCRMPDMVFSGNVVTKFVIAELGNDAGIVGAACLGE